MVQTKPYVGIDFSHCRVYHHLNKTERERRMMKDMVIKEIYRMLKECEDGELIQIIYMLLLKSSEK